MLHGAHLEFWVALKDAAEDHLTEGHPHPVIGVGQEGVADAIAVLEPKILPWARPVAMCMPRGISRSWAAAHSGSYIGLSYLFPSGG